MDSQANTWPAGKDPRCATSACSAYWFEKPLRPSTPAPPPGTPARPIRFSGHQGRKDEPHHRDSHAHYLPGDVGDGPVSQAGGHQVPVHVGQHQPGAEQRRTRSCRGAPGHPLGHPGSRLESARRWGLWPGRWLSSPRTTHYARIVPGTLRLSTRTLYQATDSPTEHADAILTSPRRFQGPWRKCGVSELMRLAGRPCTAVWPSTPEQAAPPRSAVAAGAQSPPRSLTVSDRLTVVSSHASRARLHVNARTRPLRQTRRQPRTVTRARDNPPTQAHASTRQRAPAARHRSDERRGTRRHPRGRRSKTRAAPRARTTGTDRRPGNRRPARRAVAGNARRPSKGKPQTPWKEHSRIGRPFRCHS